MTIQRQYSLPNCTLVLEGLGDTIGFSTEARPLMSTLINAECHLPGEEKPLTGGRDFLESLIAAVSQYAQEVLSGVHTARTGSGHAIEIQRLDTNHHQLVVRPSDAPPDSGIATHLTRAIELTTVQLFDLVEAVDQFLADRQTLPDLELAIQPASRRDVRSPEPIAKRAIPAAIGVSGLAVAALALAFLPAPQVRQPKDLFPAASSAPVATGSPTPNSASPTPNSASSTPNAASPTPNAASPTATTGSTTPEQAAAALDTATEITDTTQIGQLQQQLQTKLDQAWQTRSAVTQDLVYRVGMAQDGRLVGYKPVNPAALAEVNKTPMSDLLALPTPGSTPSPEPIAQYRVTFTPSGGLDVSPWKETMASASSSGTEITSTAQLEEIYPKLRSQILNSWKIANPKFSQSVLYRVRVKPDGSLIDYRPETRSASEALPQTPLPNLGQLADDSTTIAGDYAVFKVVFTTTGGLEVTPWRGWR